MIEIKVLIACEESQVVCSAFRALGHEAYSCDIVPTRGGHPEWHIPFDIRFVLSRPDATPSYFPENSLRRIDYDLSHWDMMIAHPPCTHLAVSGARWFKEKEDLQNEAIMFFFELVNADIPRIAIENPVGIMSTLYRKPDQYIQPWEYGHGETKKTCLWLKNLPLLKPTNIVEGREARVHKMPPSEHRAQDRARTYEGWANAMSSQWGSLK